ncbi:hypothetical protein Tco_0001769 [Tanacetum coccineum]
MLYYGYNFMQTKIHVDNESAICVVKNPVYHSKTKHIEIQHHFISDSYEKRLIEMVKIYTDNNVADLLTKAFDFLTFIHGLRIDMDPHEFSLVYLVISSVLVPNRGMLLHSYWRKEPLQTETPLLVFFKTEAHIEQILPHPSTYQRHRKTQNHKRTKKDTKLPRTSVPQDLKADEDVHMKGGDSVERAITTIASLDAVQDSDNIIRTQTTTMPNARSERVLEKPNEPPLLEGHTSRSGKGRIEHQFELTANVPLTRHDSPLLGGYIPGSDEGRLKLQELMTLCTKLSKQVLNLDKEKDAQAFESSDDDLDKDDASKQERGSDKIKPILCNFTLYLWMLEAKEESTMAFELIKFIKSMLEE